MKVSGGISKNFKARFRVRKYKIDQPSDFRPQYVGSPPPWNNDGKKLNLSNIFKISKKRLLSPVGTKESNLDVQNKKTQKLKDWLKYRSSIQTNKKLIERLSVSPKGWRYIEPNHDSFVLTAVNCLKANKAQW